LKQSADSACRLIEIEKNFFVLRFGLCGGGHKREMFLRFWPTLPGPGRQPNEPFFGSNFF